MSRDSCVALPHDAVGLSVVFSDHIHSLFSGTIGHLTTEIRVILEVHPFDFPQFFIHFFFFY